MADGIWNIDSNYDRLQDLTEEMIMKAENKLRVKLPTSYIDLIKEQNGGYIYFDSHPCKVPNSWAEDHVNVDHILGIGAVDEGILQSEYLIEEWGLPDKVILISGNGHTWVALDYRRETEDPPVIYVDPDGAGIVELASNFASFLKGLTNWNSSLE